MSLCVKLRENLELYQKLPIIKSLPLGNLGRKDGEEEILQIVMCPSYHKNGWWIGETLPHLLSRWCQHLSWIGFATFTMRGDKSVYASFPKERAAALR